MAAYAAVLSLTRILQQITDPDGYVLLDGYVLPETQKIESLVEKVSFLVDFLEKYSVYTDKVVKDLEIKIRDAAYEAEDIIESYIPPTSKFSRLDKKRNKTFCPDFDRIIEEIHSIQQEVMDIERMLELNYVQQRKTLSVDRSTLTFTDTTPSMVGLDKDKDKIIDWLTSSSSKLEVISIVGMGGIGKTTLARKLFDDSLIVCQFDVRAWVTVSQEYKMREIFAGLLDSMNKLNPEMRVVSDAELADRLYKSLKGRKYIIVMDDVWDTKVWDEVKRFFPDDRNGSRIVLTTRLKNVGDDAASFDHRHDMRPLYSGESWDLFREKVFGGECCPPCLEGIGQEIIKNCKGLPLSIVVIGGILSVDKTVGYWETIAATLKSVLSTDGGQCSTIFSLSYNHLPAHLKPCLLYFAIFPEDYIIRRSEVIKLWIAEGFIKPNESQSLEDIAEQCFEDLSNRSLIMALELEYEVKVEKYRIHDLLRDFCITEAQKEKFLHVINKYSIDCKGVRSERRRVSIQSGSHFNSNEPPSQTRSLLLYDESADLMVSDRSFELLRVLDMGSGEGLIRFPREVFRLVHLRYLCLRCRCRGPLIVPASISSLWGLQTLVIDSRFGDVVHLPMELWTMLHLRHVEIRNYYCELPDPPPNSNLVILANLQTLSGVKCLRLTDEIIKRIPKLKKLEVLYSYTEDWSHYHLSNMVCLNELESLHLSSNATIAFPRNFKFPAALKELSLSYCRLGWKDLTMVGSLPNLEVLKLFHLACEGQVWEPNEGEFRHLKYLEFFNLGLVEWRADDSHFPELKYLRIGWCRQLKEIPTEIGNIPTLENIELEGECSSSAVASAKLILDQQRSFGNDVLQLRILEL